MGNVPKGGCLKGARSVAMTNNPRSSFWIRERIGRFAMKEQLIPLLLRLELFSETPGDSLIPRRFEDSRKDR